MRYGNKIEQMHRTYFQLPQPIQKAAMTIPAHSSHNGESTGVHLKMWVMGSSLIIQQNLNERFIYCVQKNEGCMQSSKSIALKLID